MRGGVSLGDQGVVLHRHDLLLCSSGQHLLVEKIHALGVENVGVGGGLRGLGHLLLHGVLLLHQLVLHHRVLVSDLCSLLLHLHIVGCHLLGGSGLLHLSVVGQTS